MRYKKAKQAKETRNLIIAIIVALLVIAGIGSAFYWYTQQPTYDKETGCQLVNGRPTPTGHLVFLLDLTDPLSPQQANAARVSIERHIDEAPAGTLIELYRLQENISSYNKPLVLQCKRRDGSDADALSENARKLKKLFEQKFLTPLMNAVNESVGIQEESSQSPILEAVQSIGVTGFQHWNVDGPRTLVMYSDMIQHMPAYSMFTTRLDYKGFKKLAYAQQHQADLPGVEVELNYFYNRPKFQKMRNVQFWQYLFHDAGATVTKTFNLGQ